MLKSSFKRPLTLGSDDWKLDTVVDVMHAWLAMRPFHYALLAFELLLDLSGRWALGLVVCVLTFQFAWTEMVLRPISQSSVNSASFFTFVRSSASNPIDIVPSACFYFWVTPAGILRLDASDNEYIPVVCTSSFYNQSLPSPTLKCSPNMSFSTP